MLFFPSDRRVTHQILVGNIKKRLLLRCIHHLKSDLINSMDHMRISVNEPSSVILGQKSSSKVKNSWSESAKTSWSQKGWCN